MKKIGKKFLMCMLAGLMCFSTAACGGGDVDDWGDASTGGGQSSTASVGGEVEGVTNPYKLKVYNFTGGYGEEWLNSLVNRYKQARAGKKFTVDGKEYDGVDFELTKEKEVMTNMMNSGVQYDVWFQEQVYYNQIIENKNIFHDMTDVLTSDNPYEPGVTIESKMSDYQKEYYKRDTDGDGVKDTYYGIPHYAGYVGITYNKAMFDKYNWYFKKDYTAEDFTNLMCFIETDTDVKSVGPDGVANTSDDGLPTTYEEFFKLCELIKTKCEPITWAGKYRQEYLNWFMTALTANYEGLDQMSLNYSFDGTATNLISVADDGTVTELPDVQIKGTENGYELGKQAGKYYALKFLADIIADDYQTAGATDIVYEQTTAQKDFVYSEGTDTSDAAMLVDGCWWEMETAREFATIQQLTGIDYRNNFAWMPLPMATKEAAADRASKLSAGGKGYTLADTHNSLAFIGKQVSDDVYALAKDFLQFAYTDESLAEFSMITDTTKALNYTMTAEQKAQMSTFGRSLVDMQESADLVYTFSQNAFYRANEASFSQYKTSFSSRYTETSAVVDIAIDQFRTGVSAETYFRGLYLYQQAKWNDGSLVK